MRTAKLFLIALLLPATAWSADIGEILDKVDQNMTFESRTSTATMKIETSRRTRELELRTWGRGGDEAAIEYLAPARDKGTKMLRRGEELWMYLPAVERTQKISGHALRQGMMGSDVSYEDMTSASKLREAYHAALVRDETLDGRATHVIELTAKSDSETYAKRVAWVDAETFVPVKQELYAVSGKLLKTWTMGDVKAIGERNVPHTMTVTDEVKKGSKTTISMSEIKLDGDVDTEVFDQRWLER